MWQLIFWVLLESKSFSSVLLALLFPHPYKAMAPHSSTLAWKIPWTEEPGRLQSMGSLRVGHDWVTSLSLFTFMHWRRKWQPTPVFLPGESQGWGSLVAAVYGVTHSRTWLKWLSSSSSSMLLFGHKLSWPKALSEIHRKGVLEPVMTVVFSVLWKWGIASTTWLDRLVYYLFFLTCF